MDWLVDNLGWLGGAGRGLHDQAERGGLRGRQICGQAGGG